ncbi:UNVERIFIED_CONTAM: WD repeat-containing protein 78 [Siphonaria sp. JEL0065]|nr:WD repeat-containing protein 78 [Siphonaria sp. JEL0065]
MDASTTGLPKRGAGGGARLGGGGGGGFLGLAMAAQTNSSAHFDSSALRSKNALQTHANANSSAMMTSQRLPKQNFSSVAGSHSVAVVNGTKSMAGVAFGAEKQNHVTVLDDDGNDVTPISLLAVKGGHYKNPMMQGVDIMASAIKESVSDVLNELESMNMASWNSSNFGGRHSASTSSRASDISDDDKDDASVTSSNESLEGHATGNNDTDKFGSSENLSKRQNKNEDSHKIMHIRLQETESIILLNLPALAVCPDFLEEVATVKAANARYSELCQNRSSNENFTEKGMQTINSSKKNKDVQASGPSYASSECQATQWDIYDSFNNGSNASRHDDQAEVHIGAEDPNGPGSTSATAIANQRALSQMLAASGSVAAIRSNYASTMLQQSMSMDGTESERTSITGPGGLAGEGGESTMDSVDREAAMLAGLNQDNLKNSLLIMERAVVGNNYESKLIQYRNIQKPPEIPAQEARPQTRDSADQDGEYNEDADEDLDEDLEEEAYGANIPTLTALWTYRCEVTRGRSVMYMAFNKQNEDILVVAYGENKHAFSPHYGILLVWSLKNPEWPERIYRSTQAVTSVDFSKYTPNLLAAGYSDGRIAIYDVRQKTDVPVLDNSHIVGKHRDPVWELKWIERERGMSDDQTKGESLISISTDGRVCQWQIRKGFEHADLMVLKRVTKQAPESGGQGGREGSGHHSHGKPAALISRQAGGLCFDFNSKDRNIYLIGTEDGHIHRCSVSYNEQYLQTQFGHTGPVYKVKWSPFLPNVFLSCSADWTVRLWDAEEESCAFKFQSGKDGITDIAWSPTNATVFSCASNDGRLEVWDLKHSVLDPIVIHTVLDRQLTSLIFGSKSSCILTGDDSGSVTVFNIKKPTSTRKVEPEVILSPEEQAAQLDAVLKSKNQMAKPSAERE